MDDKLEKLPQNVETKNDRKETCWKSENWEIIYNL